MGPGLSCLLGSIAESSQAQDQPCWLLGALFLRGHFKALADGRSPGARGLCHEWLSPSWQGLPTGHRYRLH